MTIFPKGRGGYALTRIVYPSMGGVLPEVVAATERNIEWPTFVEGDPYAPFHLRYLVRYEMTPAKLTIVNSKQGNAVQYKYWDPRFPPVDLEDFVNIKSYEMQVS
jgi:hypothetical protein